MRKKSFNPVFTVCILSMLLGSFVLCSCSNGEQDGIKDDSFIELSRVCFADIAEYEEFLSANSNAIIVNPNFTLPENENNLSIIETFIKYTTTGSILNKNLEFQVGNTIYKYGKSGYTIYEIEKNKYIAALKYANNDELTSKEISKFNKTGEGKYSIEDGINLYYDGTPIIDVQISKEPLTRVAADGKTKVQAAFWKSRGAIKSSCGVKVEAWSRDNANVDFSAADTDLLLVWNININIPLATIPIPFSGSLTGHGNIIKQELDWCSGYYSYNLIKPSTISGRAKCWDGSWITATVEI